MALTGKGTAVFFKKKCHKLLHTVLFKWKIPTCESLSWVLWHLETLLGNELSEFFCGPLKFQNNDTQKVFCSVSISQGHTVVKIMCREGRQNHWQSASGFVLFAFSTHSLGNSDGVGSSLVY